MIRTVAELKTLKVRPRGRPRGRWEDQAWEDMKKIEMGN